MRSLIVNADDYGMCDGVSRGIRQSASGIVRSTTIMANLVTPQQLEALWDSGLAAGIHLNLSYGPPLSPDYPRGLLNERGSMDKVRALDAATWQDERLLEAAIDEWRAQYLRLTSLGQPPTHLDSHHHTHMHPALLEAALSFAIELGLPLRAFGPAATVARERGAPIVDLFIDSYFGAANIDRESLLMQLAQAAVIIPEGGSAELMCHPGIVDEVLLSDSSYVHERETELEVLGDPLLAVQLVELGWRLTDYRSF